METLINTKELKNELKQINSKIGELEFDQYGNCPDHELAHKLFNRKEEIEEILLDAKLWLE